MVHVGLDALVAVATEVLDEVFPIRGHRLDAHELGVITLDVEALQVLLLLSLDVHGEQIDRLDAFAFEQVVQRGGRNAHLVLADLAPAEDTPLLRR